MVPLTQAFKLYINIWDYDYDINEMVQEVFSLGTF